MRGLLKVMRLSCYRHIGQDIGEAVFRLLRSNSDLSKAVFVHAHSLTSEI